MKTPRRRSRLPGKPMFLADRYESDCRCASNRTVPIGRRPVAGTCWPDAAAARPRQSPGRPHCRHGSLASESFAASLLRKGLPWRSLCQRLIQISDQVRAVFDAAREANHVVVDAERVAVFGTVVVVA